MFMAGFRNFVQSASGYGAFVVLPAIADSIGADPEGDPEAYNQGTAKALWFCFYLALASLASNLLAWRMHMRNDSGASSEALAGGESTQTSSIAVRLRALAGTITPKPPGACAEWKLPCSFYLSTFGIQAQYFAPFAFTAFSVKIYHSKFGLSVSDASNLSGIMNLFGGLLGPIAGPLSDWLGYRAASLSAFGKVHFNRLQWALPAFFPSRACVCCCVCTGLFTVLGFALLAVGDRSAGTVWAATVLFALTYGFGDTVAYPNIRLLVGPERAGIGYGIFGRTQAPYNRDERHNLVHTPFRISHHFSRLAGLFTGLMGGMFAVAVPIVGGIIFVAEASAAPENTGEGVCWYFAGLAALASVLWWAVHVMEGSNSAIELPASKLHDLSDSSIEVAGLKGMVRGASKGALAEEGTALTATASGAKTAV
jgi:hypothetical protein